MPVGAWFNVAQGSLLTDGSMSGTRNPGFPNFARLDDGTGNNLILHLVGAASARTYASSSAAGVAGWATGNTGTFVAGTRYKIASSWITGAQLFNLNGIQPQSAAVAAIPTGLTTLRFGSDNASNILAATYLRRVAYWPRVLSASELQSVTT